MGASEFTNSLSSLIAVIPVPVESKNGANLVAESAFLVRTHNGMSASQAAESQTV